MAARSVDVSERLYAATSASWKVEVSPAFCPVLKHRPAGPWKLPVDQDVTPSNAPLA